MSRTQKAYLGFALLCVVVVLSFVLFLRGQRDGYSKLLIDPAYAQDNFQVQATQIDSIGVESTTAFDIKSKSKVDAGLLEKNIALLPAADFDFKQLGDQDFRLTPKEPLAGRQVYKLQIASAYLTADGTKQERDYSWAFQVKENFKVLQTLPRNEATGVPLDTGIEISFSQDNFTAYEDKVRIEPAVKGRFEKHGRTLAFVPEGVGLTAGTLYTVTVSKDLPLSGSDKRLDGDFVFRFEADTNGAVRGAESAFDFEKEFSEFSSQNAPVFGFYGDGNLAGTLPVQIFAFPGEPQFMEALRFRSQVPYWARYSRQTYLQDVAGLSAVASYKLSVSRYSYQQFVTLPNALPRGYYLAQVQSGNLTRQAYFQVTDLAVYASVTKTDTLVWANDTVSKAPAAGVSVRNTDGSQESKTDASGLARIPTEKFLGLREGEHADAYLRVGNGDHATIVPLGIDYAGTGAVSADNYWYYLYTDRSLYKTDDTIRFWGFVKARGAQKTGEEMTVRLTKGDYYDYYYEPLVISEMQAKIQDGTITGEMPLQNLTPGYYYLEFSLDGKTISTQYIDVETYTKPAYELQLAPERAGIFAGENIVLDARAKFFEGTPVAQLGVSYKRDEDTPVGIATDGNGAARIVLPTTYADCSQNSYCFYPGYSNIRLYPTGAEEGEISAGAMVRVFGAQVKASTTFTQVGDGAARLVTQVNKVDLDKYNRGTDAYSDNYLGVAAPGVSLRAQITEISYLRKEEGTYYDFINKIVRKQYSYQEVKKPLSIYSGTTDAQGRHVYDFPISLDKSYEVKVVAEDGAGRVDMVRDYLYTSRGGEERYDNYQLRFSDPAKREAPVFSLDEEVKLDFVNNDTPVAENGQRNFLYYKLQNGLLSYDLSAKAAYSFPFEAKFVPNIFVEGVWFDGSSYHESSPSSWNGSGIEVRFDSSGRLLNISLRTDKEKYAPGEEVTLSAEVKDQKGKPVRTNLNLNLVDEAFYALSEERVDTLAMLYGNTVNPGLLVSYASHELPVGMMGGAERGGCFAAGTRITMADGSAKNIEDVRAGDSILTFENGFARKLVPAKVAATYRHRVQDYLLINGTLRVTPQHRIFVNGGWEPIGMAKVGDYLTDAQGRRVRIDSIAAKQELILVYNLQVEGYHTFLADGIYVHNDKDGGRTDFVDNALFRSVETGSNGKAQVRFKLPDNITSWRVTAQGISDALSAGHNTAKIAVSLPVFATNTYASEYLASDRPTIKVNSYGEALAGGAAVDYQVSAPTLGLNFTSKGKAFEPQYVPLSQLSEGKHQITVGVKAGRYEDKMTEPIEVTSSRLKTQDQKFYALSEGLRIEGSAQGRTTVVFTDKNQGQFLSKLTRLEWTDGDRVDQKLSRVLASELEKRYFGKETDYTEEFEGNVYQLPQGGIALLPYGDEDLELSAKLASIAGAHFDTDALRNYFYSIYGDQASTGEEVGLALFGLASLDEPVLIPLQHYAALPELSPKMRIYAALALYQMGDEETARGTYLELLGRYAEHLEPYVRLKVSDNQDEVLQATALMAILAGGVGDQYRDQLWSYASENDGKDLLTNTEELMYVSETLPRLRAGASSFTLHKGEKQEDIVLKSGKTYELSLLPQELASLSFSDLKGSIGVSSIFEVPATSKQTSAYVAAGREYRVNGSATSTLHENDLVEVVLNPRIDAQAPGEEYQFTDLLPSGLKVVTEPYMRDHGNDGCIRYPFEIEGQKVKFYLGKSWYDAPPCGNTFSYLARVVSLGDFAAEPAVIESLKVPSVKNYSSAGRITITR